MFFQCQPSLSARSFELQVYYALQEFFAALQYASAIVHDFSSLPKKVMKYATKSRAPKKCTKKVTVPVWEHPPYFHNHLPQVPKTSASSVRFKNGVFQGWKLCQATRPTQRPGAPHMASTGPEGSLDFCAKARSHNFSPFCRINLKQRVVIWVIRSGAFVCCCFFLLPLFLPCFFLGWAKVHIPRPGLQKVHPKEKFVRLI